MTTQKKASIAGGVTIAGIVAILALWPQLKPWLEWVAPIFERESVQHVALGWLAAAFTLPLPWVMPKQMAPIWTKTFAAALAASVAIITVIVLAWPVSRTDVIYALFMAGMGSVTINGGLTTLFLHLRPCAKPMSLEP